MPADSDEMMKVATPPTMGTLVPPVIDAPPSRNVTVPTLPGDGETVAVNVTGLPAKTPPGGGADVVKPVAEGAAAVGVADRMYSPTVLPSETNLIKYVAPGVKTDVDSVSFRPSPPTTPLATRVFAES